MKLVIDRKKWQRGSSALASLLHPTTKKMCCLGFYALACGYTEEEIEGYGEPTDLVQNLKKDIWPIWVLNKKFITRQVDVGEWIDEYVHDNTDDIDQLITANDSEEIADDAREEKIASIFARHDVEVEFV